MGALMQTPIYGTVWENLTIIPASGGCVLKMLTPDNPLTPNFEHGFGELYFSEINSGEIRAWKCHKRQNQLFCVPMGLIKIGMYDARVNSPSCGKACSFLLGRPNYYRLLRLPAGIWYGFECLSKNSAIICNFADLPHNPDEMERADLHDPIIPAEWLSLVPAG